MQIEMRQNSKPYNQINILNPQFNDLGKVSIVAWMIQTRILYFPFHGDYWLWNERYIRVIFILHNNRPVPISQMGVVDGIGCRYLIRIRITNRQFRYIFESISTQNLQVNYGWFIYNQYSEHRIEIPKFVLKQCLFKLIAERN